MLFVATQGEIITCAANVLRVFNINGDLLARVDTSASPLDRIPALTFSKVGSRSVE